MNFKLNSLVALSLAAGLAIELMHAPAFRVVEDRWLTQIVCDSLRCTTPK